MLEASDDPNEEENPVFDGQFLFDAAMPSGVQEMMVSNRSDFAGAEWEPFAKRKKWTLAPRADGMAAVFVKYRDGAGNESDVSGATYTVDPKLSSSENLYLPLIEN